MSIVQPPSLKQLPNLVAVESPLLLAEENQKTSQQPRNLIHSPLPPGDNLSVKVQVILCILWTDVPGRTTPLSNLLGVTAVDLIFL